MHYFLEASQQAMLLRPYVQETVRLSNPMLTSPLFTDPMFTHPTFTRLWLWHAGQRDGNGTSGDEDIDLSSTEAACTSPEPSRALDATGMLHALYVRKPYVHQHPDACYYHILGRVPQRATSRHNAFES